jgi:tripartite-type tricarboxylate transporter receptor subunit TctC
MRRLRLLASLAALAVLAAGASERASAQADAGTGFPSKPIRFVVGYAAGGGNDIFARLVGDKVREFLGQPVVIENKPGGGGRLAGEYVMGQPADGYTVLVGAAGMMALVPVIYPRTSYHPTRTYTPLSMIASFPLILAVPGSHPARSLAELIAWAKAHPDKANYATSSPAFTITTELLKLKTGMPGVPIPYKSTNEMIVSVASEQTLFAIGDGPPTVPLVQSGKIRALAVTGAERSLELPDVPTMAELGLPQVSVRLWSGLFISGMTPPTIKARLESAVRRALADAGVRDKLKAMATDPGGMSSDDFARVIEGDIKLFGEVSKAANLKFDE